MYCSILMVVYWSDILIKGVMLAHFWCRFYFKYHPQNHLCPREIIGGSYNIFGVW